MLSCGRKRVSLVLTLLLILSLLPIPSAHADPVSWLLSLERITRLFEETGLFAKVVRPSPNSGGGMDPNGNRNPGSPPPSHPPGNHG